MSSTREYKFRSAVPDDADLILEFMALLAVYSRKAHLMGITAGQIRKWVFEDRHVEVIFVLDDDGREAGFALFFRTFWAIEGKQGIYIENLLVREEYRGQGYGRALLDRLARICAERGLKCMEWDCLAWNEAGLGFYEKWGARKDGAYITMYVPDVTGLPGECGGCLAEPPEDIPGACRQDF